MDLSVLSCIASLLRHNRVPYLQILARLNDQIQAISCKLGRSCSCLGYAGLRECVTLPYHDTWPCPGWSLLQSLDAVGAAGLSWQPKHGRCGFGPAQQRFQPSNHQLHCTSIRSPIPRRTRLAISGYRIASWILQNILYTLATSFSTLPVHRSPDQSNQHFNLQFSTAQPSLPARTPTRNPDQTHPHQINPRERDLIPSTPKPTPPPWRRGTTTS